MCLEMSRRKQLGLIAPSRNVLEKTRRRAILLKDKSSREEMDYGTISRLRGLQSGTRAGLAGSHPIADH